MTIIRRLACAAITVVGAATLMVVGSQWASAATPRNGVCEVGEICFYFYTDRLGSISDFTTSIPNYGTSQPSCYEFRTEDLDGYERCMKNLAESVWNRTSTPARVYFNSNYCGPFDAVAGNTWRNLAVTWNDNASHKFSSFPGPC